MAFTIREILSSDEGDADIQHAGIRRIWQMVGDSAGVPGLPDIGAIYEDPPGATIGAGGDGPLPPYNDPHPRWTTGSRTIPKLDRYRIERESQKSYLVVGYYSTDKRWRFPDPVPIAVDGALFDYSSEFLIKPIPVAKLQHILVPYFLGPLPAVVRHFYAWQPHDTTLSVRVTQDRWTLRRDEVELTSPQRAAIRDQNNKLHVINFDDRDDVYKFSGSFRQTSINPNTYDVVYEWISDPGVRELHVDGAQRGYDSALDFEMLAWPGKLPIGVAVPWPSGHTYAGTVEPYPWRIQFQPPGLVGTLPGRLDGFWAIPPWYECHPIAPQGVPVSAGLSESPDKFPPVFNRIFGYEIGDVYALPPLWE